MLSPNCELHIESKIPWQLVYTEKYERALLLSVISLLTVFRWNKCGIIRVAFEFDNLSKQNLI